MKRHIVNTTSRIILALCTLAMLCALVPLAHADEATVIFDPLQVTTNSVVQHSINQTTVISGTIDKPVNGQTITLDGVGINLVSIDGQALEVMDAEHGNVIGTAVASSSWPDGASEIPSVDPATNATAGEQFQKFNKVAQNSHVVITLKDVDKYNGTDFKESLKFKITYENRNTSVRMSPTAYTVDQHIDYDGKSLWSDKVTIPAYEANDFGKAVTAFDSQTGGVQEDGNGKTTVSLNGHIFQGGDASYTCNMIHPGETFTFTLAPSSSILFDPDTLVPGQEIPVSRSGHLGKTGDKVDQRQINQNGVIVSWGTLGKYVVDSVNTDGTQLTVKVVEAPAGSTRDVFFNIPAQLMNPGAINRTNESVEQVNVVSTVYHSVAGTTGTGAACNLGDIVHYAAGSTNPDAHLQSVPFRLTTAAAADLVVPRYNVDVRYVDENGTEIASKKRELNQVIFNTPYDIQTPQFTGYTFKEVQGGEALTGNVSRYPMTVTNDPKSRTKTFTLIYKKNVTTPNSPAKPNEPKKNEPAGSHNKSEKGGALAQTGVDVIPLAGIVAVLIVAAAGALMVSRKKQA